MNFEGRRSPEFNFSSEKVRKTLESAVRRGTEFVGTATSDFQSHPHRYDGNGNRKISSDWEREAARMAEKQHHDPSEFPRFFEKKELYIRRSAELGQNMFRLSFDFGRLCPAPGVFDEASMAEYVELLALIRASGQEPMVTLYHWPTPTHLLEIDKNEKILAGAWEHRDVVRHFHFYVKCVVDFLSNKDVLNAILEKAGHSVEMRERLLAEGLVRYFVSVNEPINLLLPTYVLGLFPPFKRGRFDLLNKVLSKVVEAHDVTIAELKSHLMVPRGGVKVGVAHNWVFFKGLLGKIPHFLANVHVARKFERDGKDTDFIGLQYYFRTDLSIVKREKKIYGDNPYFGDIHPPGIFQVLRSMHTEYPHKDIFITEFGFSEKTDARRPFWILETFRHVIEAMERGIPVKGMLLWTLVDNFEWNLGLGQKFGLFNERELDRPLAHSEGNTVRSWEVWQAVAHVLRNPSVENLTLLSAYYERAWHQFHAWELR